MAINLERFKADLERLSTQATAMISDLYKRLGGKKDDNLTATIYQSWYSEAREVVRQLLPARLSEFVSLYERDPRRKEINVATYSIQDFLLGLGPTANFMGEVPYDKSSVVLMRLQAQKDILESCYSRFKSSLFEIRQIVQADLFDSEIDGARELIKRGFIRAAGAICGVVIEKHLAQVADDHQVPIKKKNPTISDLNDALKEANIYDVPQWRQIQRLGDLRNICSHNKDREPTKEESEELVNSTEKLLKTLA